MVVNSQGNEQNTRVFGFSDDVNSNAINFTDISKFVSLFDNIGDLHVSDEKILFPWVVN